MACAYFGLIPAAGTGSRFGAAAPKQYRLLCDRPLVEHAVRALACAAQIRTIYVVLAPGDEHFRRCRFDCAPTRVVALYCGGPTRAASVFNGLIAVRDDVEDGDWMLVHDAARPCLEGRELARLLAEVADDEVGGLLALPVTDTLKRADDRSRSGATVARDGLWRALTPQMFRYRLLVEALHAADRTRVTDEAAAIEALGLKPRLVPGAPTNIKVTHPQDLALAQAILEAQARTA